MGIYQLQGQLSFILLILSNWALDYNYYRFPMSFHLIKKKLVLCSYSGLSVRDLLPDEILEAGLNGSEGELGSGY